MSGFDKIQDKFLSLHELFAMVRFLGGIDFQNAVQTNGRLEQAWSVILSLSSTQTLPDRKGRPLKKQNAFRAGPN